MPIGWVRDRAGRVAFPRHAPEVALRRARWRPEARGRTGRRAGRSQRARAHSGSVRPPRTAPAPQSGQAARSAGSVAAKIGRTSMPLLVPAGVVEEGAGRVTGEAVDAAIAGLDDAGDVDARAEDVLVGGAREARCRHPPWTNRWRRSGRPRRSGTAPGSSRRCSTALAKSLNPSRASAWPSRPRIAATQSASAARAARIRMR